MCTSPRCSGSLSSPRRRWCSSQDVFTITILINQRCILIFSFYFLFMGLLLFFFIADEGTFPSIEPSLNHTSLFSPNPVTLLLFQRETSTSFELLCFKMSSIGGAVSISRV